MSAPGRSYRGITEDKGISLEADWDLGGARLDLDHRLSRLQLRRSRATSTIAMSTSSTVPIRAVVRRFQTFSQEVRLQGTTLDGHLDWLVGGYYANEDLTLTDNLRFGNQYGRFATCRIVSRRSASPRSIRRPRRPASPARPRRRFGAASPLVYRGARPGSIRSTIAAARSTATPRTAATTPSSPTISCTSPIASI